MEIRAAFGKLYRKITYEALKNILSQRGDRRMRPAPSWAWWLRAEVLRALYLKPHQSPRALCNAIWTGRAGLPPWIKENQQGRDGRSLMSGGTRQQTIMAAVDGGVFTGDVF